MMNELDKPPIVEASFGNGNQELLNAIDSIFEKDVRPVPFKNPESMTPSLVGGVNTIIASEDCPNRINHG